MYQPTYLAWGPLPAGLPPTALATALLLLFGLARLLARGRPARPGALHQLEQLVWAGIPVAVGLVLVLLALGRLAHLLPCPPAAAARFLNR